MSHEIPEVPPVTLCLNLCDAKDTDLQPYCSSFTYGSVIFCLNFCEVLCFYFLLCHSPIVILVIFMPLHL